jgi:hypothetical protein
MEATVNKQAAINGYAAFGALDADAAMKDISDSIEWVVGGDNALTGTYRGKVVVICDVEFGGETAESADLLTFDDEGKMIRFQTFGDEGPLDRLYPR